MPSEAKKYWQYSQECTRQAVEAETAELRDQLLDLARMWTEAALCEEMNAANRSSLNVAAKIVESGVNFNAEYWCRGNISPAAKL